MPIPNGWLNTNVDAELQVRGGALPVWGCIPGPCALLHVCPPPGEPCSAAQRTAVKHAAAAMCKPGERRASSLGANTKPLALSATTSHNHTFTHTHRSGSSHLLNTAWHSTLLHVTSSQGPKHIRYCRLPEYRVHDLMMRRTALEKSSRSVRCTCLPQVPSAACGTRHATPRSRLCPPCHPAAMHCMPYVFVPLPYPNDTVRYRCAMGLRFPSPMKYIKSSTHT